MRVLLWGTYDLGKPRVRILVRALKAAFDDVAECHVDVWSAIEDKSQVRGWAGRLRLAIRWLLSYPRLLWLLLRSPRPEVVVVPYLGHFDVLVLWPYARITGVAVVWDAFLSLYDTVVLDRRLISPRNPLARLLYAWEWLALRAVNTVVLDTRAHTDFFADTYRVPRERFAVIPVGAEERMFSPAVPRPARAANAPLRVLFYGQFIPLHGIGVIVEAARLTRAEAITWTLIGRGQEAPRIRALLDADPLAQLQWIEWVDYAGLAAHIAQADICLGIFGTSNKAARVVPNKVYQVLAVGRPLITRDSPAMRELTLDGEDGITLIGAGDAAALADAVRAAATGGPLSPPGQALRERVSEAAIQSILAGIIRRQR